MFLWLPYISGAQNWSDSRNEPSLDLHCDRSCGRDTPGLPCDQTQSSSVCYRQSSSVDGFIGHRGIPHRGGPEEKTLPWVHSARRSIQNHQTPTSLGCFRLCENL